MKCWLTVAAVLCCTLAGQAQEANPGLGALERLMDRTGGTQSVLVALRTTGDPELAVLFDAAGRRGDIQQRRFALEALQELGGDQARQTFLWVLQNEADPDLRSQAMAYLAHDRALSTEQLVVLLENPQNDVRLLAARQLLVTGQGQMAMPALEAMSGAKDPATLALARMSLLSLGRSDLLEPVTAGLTGAKADPQVVIMVLEAAVEDKLQSLAAPALQVAQQSTLMPVRLSGYRTYAALEPAKAADALAEAITKTEQTVLRVRLMWALADLADSRDALKQLATRTDVAGQLAQFELARPGGGDAAEQALVALLKQDHPVVIDYVLERAKADVAARPAQSGFYVKPLLALVGSVDRQARAMGAQHMRAARAATLVADIGNEPALTGLRAMVNGPFDAVSRTAAAGLVQTANKDAAELARPLLTSQHEELSTDALMVLGRLGDPAAAPGLTRLLDQPGKHRDEMIALAGWYLLKINNQQALGAAALADRFR